MYMEHCNEKIYIVCYQLGYNVKHRSAEILTNFVAIMKSID